LRTVHLIVNPNAGTRRARRFLPDIISAFNREDDLCAVYLTEKRGDALSFVRAHAGEADLIVACGGDGTLNEVISGLQLSGCRTPLGFIPFGSTNDFAAGLGLPPEPLSACRSILSGSPRNLDIGLFAPDRYFCYTASFGAFTGVSWSTPQNVKNILGRAAYFLEGIRSLADIRPIHMKITADGSVYEDDFIFGAVCNSTSLGGVLRLEDRDVDMNDGRFEALFIPFPPDLPGLNRILTSIRTRAYEDDSLHFLHASAFVFEGPADLKWTLDGEEANGRSHVEIRNIHDAIRLVCRNPSGD